jgi:hypothetical protein
MAETKSKSKRLAAAGTAAPGVIDAQSLYTVEEARRRLRLGEWAWRQMRRDGLVVLRVAGRAFVTGQQLISYIESKGRG